MALAGDRIQPSMGQGYSDTVVTDDTVDANGYKGAAKIVQIGDASGSPIFGTGTNAVQVQGNVTHDAVDAGNPVEIGGYAKATAPSDVSADADRVRAWFLRNGAMAMFMAYALNKSDDALTAWPPQGSTVNTPAIITSAGTVLAANASRKKWSIQNLGTNPLFVRFGAAASTTVFHLILAAGSGADNGTGDLYEDDNYLGVVSVDGTSPRCVVSELT